MPDEASPGVQLSESPCGQEIYEIEVVTNTDSLTVEGEGEILTFVAKHHFTKVEGACDSVLLLCGLKSRSVRDAALSAWIRGRVWLVGYSSLKA